MTGDLKRVLSTSIATPSERPAKQPSLSPISVTSGPRDKSAQMRKPYFRQTFFADQEPDSSDEDASYSQQHGYTFASVSSPYNAADSQSQQASLESQATALSFTPINAVERLAVDDEEAEESVNDSEDVEMGTDTDPDLPTMSEKERQLKYADIWSGRSIALPELRAPRLCEGYPSLAAEIIKAYLEHVTVIAKVWVNYDSRLKAFFVRGERPKDCGLVYLSPKQRCRLEQLDWTTFEIQNLQLDVGTPFRTLFKIWHTSIVENAGTAFRATSQAKDQDHAKKHHSLEAFVKNNMISVARKNDWCGTDGFRLEDVDKIAARYLYVPKNWSEMDRYCID